MAVIPQRRTSGKLDKTGGLSLTVNYKVDTLEDVLMTAPSKQLLGIPEDERTFEQEEEGKGRFTLRITYKGGSPTGQPGKGGQPPEEARWSTRRVDREEPIESHPQIEKLKKEFEGTVNAQKKVEWPETIKEGVASTGVFVGPSYVEKKNPMFGVKTYPVRELEAVATYTYGSPNLPADFFDGAGKVLDKLPTPRIGTKNGYVWIVMNPEAEDLGPKAWKIRQPYRMVKKAGWQAQLQKALQE